MLRAAGRLLADLFLRATGWRIEGDFPRPRRFVVVGAPHTSWFDFLLTLALMGHLSLRLEWLGKGALFRGPAGVALTWMGGIPVDRESSAGVVERLAERFRGAEELVIGVAPEGTRRRTERWRSGFYRLALAAGVPVVPVRVEADRRVLCIGPSLVMTGLLERDVEAMAEFFRPACGVRPGAFGPVRWE